MTQSSLKSPGENFPPEGDLWMSMVLALAAHSNKKATDDKEPWYDCKNRAEKSFTENDGLCLSRVKEVKISMLLL